MDGCYYILLKMYIVQMMVDGVNGLPTNPYAGMSQLSGLAEVIVDSGRKAINNVV